MTPSNTNQQQPELTAALLELNNNHDIIIKSADRNLGLVIMDKLEYISLATDDKNLGDNNVYFKFELELNTA